MNRIVLVGLNHTTAPLAVREKIAFPGEQRLAALAALRSRWPEAEAVLVSTCNRVELYISRPVHAHPREEEMIEFIASFHRLKPEEISPHLYRKTDKSAVTHLFTVAASLDSMVLAKPRSSARSARPTRSPATPPSPEPCSTPSSSAPSPSASRS